jgi:ATP-binding cassette subfamily B protein
MSPSADLPSSINSLWRSLKLGYRAEPMLLVVSFVVTMAAALPDALFALWLALFAKGITSHDDTYIAISVAGLGSSTAAGWLLRIVSERLQRRFRDKATITIEAHVAELQASVAGIELHERPEYLDRLSVLRDQVFTLNHLYMSIFGVMGWVLRLAVTVALLISIHPALALLALFALPTVFVSSWRAAKERVAEERGAQHNRLARHLFQLATTAPPGKEVRVAGIGAKLVADRRAAWQQWYGPVARVRWGTAFWQAGAWALFGGAFVAAIVFVATGLNASVGDTLLVLAAGSRLSQYLNATVGEVGFLRGIWLDASRRLAWLEDYSKAVSESADQPVPERLQHGIKFEDVSFAYPGTTRLVLEHVNLDLPAGTVIAVVGENGAGKSTLVKLLCRLYDPTSGMITVDGADLSRIPPEGWRERFAGAFQDFFRFEFQACRTVGLGDVERLDERPAVEVAVTRGGAEDVVARLTAGLDTQLGPTWRDGVELSFGQWQKLALARGFMRDNPLVLVLDEPTAALDAETEHALFERYSEAARAGSHSDGRITILVSHRFSTVRMADLIVVLDGAHVVEFGSHEELMAHGGQYSELYGIQAAAYR